MAGLLVGIVAMGILWAVVRPRDPPFRGKLESQWVENLANNDEEQAKQCQGTGADRLRVLVRALDGSNQPLTRFYGNTYQLMSALLPGGVMHLLPSTRMKVISLLSNFGRDAQEAVPAMSRALKDKDEAVQQIAVCFFIDAEGDDALLNRLSTELKRELLPEFIRALGNGRDWGLRNNAALALRYYPEERKMVVPALAKALKDPTPRVRIVAAESLHCVASDVVRTEEVVRVVIGVLRHPDDQIAYRAAALLGKMREHSALTVPALIESVHSRNCLVASSAASALGSFPEHAELIVPVLLGAYHDTNSVVSRWASGGALKKIAPDLAASIGLR